MTGLGGGEVRKRERVALPALVYLSASSGRFSSPGKPPLALVLFVLYEFYAGFDDERWIEM